jgi:outer membrane protein TolC
MSNGVKVLRFFCAIAVGISFLSGNLVAQSPITRHITLEEAQEQSTNKMADIARYTVDVAKYARQAAQADYWPKLDAYMFNLHFNKFLGQQIQLFQKNASIPLAAKNQTIVAATVTQPVTPLLKIHQAVEIAKADEVIAQSKASEMTAQVASKVQHIYFELLIAQRQYSVIEAKIKRVEGGLQIAAAGTVQPDGMAKRQAVDLEATKELLTAQSRVAELTRSLNTLIGFAPDTELELTLPAPQLFDISEQTATQQAQLDNPEVVEAVQTVNKAEAAKTLSKLDYIPTVAVIGGYIYQNAVPALPLDFSVIGFEATWNLFDFGKREKIISEHNAQVALARANVDLVKAKVAATAQKAFLDLQRLRKIRDLTRRVAGTYPMVPVNYQNAQLETNSERAQAEIEMLQAELDYREAYSQLKRVIEGR